MRTSSLRRTFAPILGATLAVASAGAVATATSAVSAPAPSNCRGSGGVVTCLYTSPGDYQLALPDDVEQVSVVAVGGAGGRSKSIPGGYGQRVSDTSEVEPGRTVFITVGGAATGTGCLADIECQGGYNGGGFGGAGGGGGGASTVSAGKSLAVAGGGGGAGATGADGTGGAGGAAGLAGSAGTGILPGGGGTPGTATAAGTGGMPVGTDGGSGTGGSSLGNTNGGGGGGGGLWGGGSGSPSWNVQTRQLATGGGGGGGGGSSYAPHAANAIGTATVREGSVEIRFATGADITAPEITIDVAPFFEAEGPNGRQITYSVTATDDVNGPVLVSCDPASGTDFAIGATTITCTASDFSGNLATKTATVSVGDSTEPDLTVPVDFTVPATSPNGARVTYTATAIDSVAGTITPDCEPGSGSAFRIGTTEVECTARDSYDNVTTKTFTVHSVRPGAAGAEGAAEPDRRGHGSMGSRGDVRGHGHRRHQPTGDGRACAPASGSTFGFDTTTTVSCTATDDAGNATTKTFTVTVVDTTKPTVTVPASIQEEAVTDQTARS